MFLFCERTRSLTLVLLFCAVTVCTAAYGQSAVGLSPANLVFGTQLLGTTTSQIVTVTNTGNATLTITNISAAPGDYTQKNSCIPAGSATGTVAPSASCSVTVSFKPAQTGPRNGSLTITDDAANSPQSMTLTGTGTVIQLLPSSLTFSSQLVGTSSAPQSITFTNRGSTTSTITGISASAGFQQTNTCIPSGASTGTVAGGGSCTISVVFSPSAAGSVSGTVTVTHLGGGSPQSVNLSGTATTSSGGSVTLTPSSLTFPTQLLGSTTSQTVSYSNTGSGSATISGISITPSDFTQSNTCIPAGSTSGTVPAGGSCSIVVSFKPAQTGPRNGSLTITDDATGSPRTVALAGVGTVIDLAPSTLTFAAQRIGTTSGGQTVTFKNRGSTTSTITGITTTAGFLQTNTCIPSGSTTGSVAPAASCTISVTFSPTQVGAVSGTLTVTHLGGGSPQSVSLNGTGSNDPISLSPSSLTFASQNVGTTSAAQSVTITNNGTTAVTLNSIVGTSDYLQTNTCIPAGSTTGSLAAGGSCSISITFKPVGAGTRLGSVTINDSTAASPHVISLSGTGVSTTPTSGGAVVISPESTCTGLGQQVQFTAAVTGLSSTAVTWSVDGVTGGNATVGTISASGLYTAPSAAGSHSIKAVSQANTAKTDTSNVSVQSAVSAFITPRSAAVLTGTSVQLNGNVCGSVDNGLSWFVDNVPVPGNATVGTLSIVNSVATYTAPATAGAHVIKVQSTADPTKTGQITVTAFSQVQADFGSRLSGVTIPSGMIGAQLGFLQDQPTLNLMGTTLTADGGFATARIYGRVSEVFSSGPTTPNWTLIDPTIDKLKLAGIHPVVMLAFTPPWLQPSPSPCNGVTTAVDHVVPSNVNSWAQLAAQYVAHFDQKYGDWVQDYEIWNEPDLASFLCVTGNAITGRINAYLSIFGAAAPAMKQQAATDLRTIRVGGPAVSNPLGSASNFIPSLLSNAGTATQVDFVSYHQYLGGGQPQIDAGMTWDVNTPATTSLYLKTQDPTFGAAGLFKTIANTVNAGTQPNASQTPIYLSEYSDNSAFSKDCCRSDPSFGPLWNSLYLSDLLNSVFNGTTKVPAKMNYYAASAPPFFCLFGTINATMNCTNTGGYSPYPQFYAYQLFSSRAFLGLLDGGNMAASVSPPTTQSGLVATAFYTATRNNIVIVNPTPVTYTGLPVVGLNLGFASTQADMYLLNSGNPQITHTPITLSTVSGGISATIDVPPYSTVAISVAKP